jgi:8-oxo-dGTP diphosphatase
VIVVAAVIEENNQFLLTRRQPGVHLAGMWEFPGGKIDAAETHAIALQREIARSSTRDVDVGELVFHTSHAYEDRQSNCSSIGARSWARRGPFLDRKWAGCRASSCRPSDFLPRTKL